MDSKRNVVDMSCFFIFEATGDSESDLFVDPVKSSGNTTIARDGDDNLDDAESCSHDYDDYEDDDNGSDNNFHGNEVINGRLLLYDNVQVCIDEREEEGEEAHSYYPTWPHEPINNNKNNKNGQKNSSHEELLSEMERNKLFWETCLAS